MGTAEEKLQQFAPVADLMPGIVIIHELYNFPEYRTVFMNTRGTRDLGINLQELTQMGSEYTNRFFNNEAMEDFVHRLNDFIQKKDPEETLTFFLQIKLKDREEWVWHMHSTKLFHQDEEGNPTHIITMAFPVENMKHIPNKAERLLAENKFFRNNGEKFHSLGQRAKEVLKLVALGKSSAEISSDLNITVDTVNTHRKIIKKKLGIHTNYEFIKYAYAFDLI